MSGEDRLPESGRYVRPQDIDNRAGLGQRVTWLAETALWYALYWYPMRALPIETASNVGGALMRFLGPRLSGSVQRTVMRNLRLALPELADTERQAIARGAWEMTGRVAAEMPHLHRLQPGDRVEISGDEYVAQIKESGKPAVLIGAHLANWEVMSAAICSRLDCQITYRALNNPWLDRCVTRARYAAGISVLTPKGVGTRDLMRALRAGQSVGLMNDQKFNQGVAAPFFGHPAMTAPGPTRLAIKFGLPILPLSVRRLGPARYRVSFHQPFPPDPAPDEDAAILATVTRINSFYEARIREAPEQWFWLHNRWPKEAWAAAGVM